MLFRSNAVFLDNNSNIGFGIGGLDTTYNKNITIYGTNSNVLKFGNGTTGIGALAGFDIGQLNGVNKSDAYVWNRQTANTIFGTNNNEAARINSSGSVSVAGTGALCQFNVNNGNSSLAAPNCSSIGAYGAPQAAF